MSEPHRHHFVPAFYLKQWAAPDGKVVEFSRVKGRLQRNRRGPDSTGFREKLYTFPELPPEIAARIETHFLKPADGEAHCALQNLLSGQHGPWTQQMMSAWARFLFGLRLRHFDSIPEIREGIKRAWEVGREDSEREYERIKTRNHPPTFDEYIREQDKSFLGRIEMNLLAAALDNARIGTHIVNMAWGVMDIHRSSHHFLTSDWALDLSLAKGIVSLPISPTQLFVAADTRAVLADILNQDQEKIIRTVNEFVVGRARRYVWSRDESQRRFVENRMSTNLVPKPFFPSLLAM